MDNVIDTILKEDDNNNIDKLMNIKYNLFKFINRDELIKYLVYLIDSSECITFERNGDRNYISHNKPSINLVLNLEKIDELYNVESMNGNYSKKIQTRTNVVYKEIINPFSKLFINIFNRILDREIEDASLDEWIDRIVIHEENLKDKINNINTDDIDNLKFIFSSISSIGFPPNVNNLDLNVNRSCNIEFLL
jgi:hypothetical protein